MNKSLINLLNCQQKMQNDTTHALHIIHQSQQHQANDSLTDDIQPSMENLSCSLT